MSTRPETTPNYRTLPDEEFAARVDELWRRYADCDLCAYDCRVDRTAGETGVCRVDDTASPRTSTTTARRTSCAATTAAGRSSSRTAT